VRSAVAATSSVGAAKYSVRIPMRLMVARPCHGTVTRA
jgi:hypothetical protein